MLDNIPLVCKRWNALAGDPGAWRGVRLVVDVGSDSHMDALRVLLHAPALRRLTVQCDCWRLRVAVTARRQRAQLESTLRRSRAAVTEVHLHSLCCAATLPFLLQTRRHVSLLHLNVLEHAEADRGNGILFGVPGVLNQLSSLQYLQLHFCLSAPLSYNGELKDKLQSLHGLHFEVYGVDCPQLTSLVLDVVSGASRSLRYLYLNWRSLPNNPLPSVLEESIALCSGLTVLTISMLSAGVVRHMAQLKKLLLHLLPTWGLSAETVLKTVHILGSCQVLPALEALAITAMPKREYQLRPIEQLIKAVLRLSPNATLIRFTLSPDFWAQSLVSDAYV